MFLSLPLNQDIANQPIVVSTTLGQVVTWLVIGLIAGLLANFLVRGRGTSLGNSIIIGLVGAVIGGFLFSLLGVQVSPALRQGIVLPYIDIIVSFVGAIIVLILVTSVRRRG
jgi:uncharacterized membrane protein YeaQ/YmgE (transglycosylase-associated protein family)